MANDVCDICGRNRAHHATAASGHNFSGPSPDDLTHYMQACSRLRDEKTALEQALIELNLSNDRLAQGRKLAEQERDLARAERNKLMSATGLKAIVDAAEQERDTKQAAYLLAVQYADEIAVQRDAAEQRAERYKAALDQARPYVAYAMSKDLAFAETTLAVVDAALAEPQE